MKNKTVDIVIPTYRPGEEFCDLLLRLKQQTYPVNQIIVVNTETDIFPEKLCNELGISVVHIKKEEFDHGGTRNLAFELSEAEVVVFMTQDAKPANRLLIERLVHGFADDCVAAAYARQLPNQECSIIEKYTRQFNYPRESLLKSYADIERMGIKTFFCSNVCAAYRRDVYMEVGGFEKRTIFNEDMIFAGKLIQKGYKIAYEADAMVIHSHNYSGIQQFHRNFDLAVSQIDHPEVFSGISSEKEGISLVFQTAKWLIRNKRLFLLPNLVYQSWCKYLGYRLGCSYRRLPQWIVLKCTMNTAYWEKKVKRDNDN